MFRFGSPEFLYLLILLPIMVIIYFYSLYRRRKNIVALGEVSMIKKLTPQQSLLHRNIKFFLLLLTSLMFIFMLARPQFGSKIEEVKTQGIEVVIALDISNSMLVKDITPSRLEKAKLTISKLIDKLEESKVGLVVFAGDAFVQVPITKDYISIKMFLESISTSLITNQGTNIPDAISIASRCFSSDKEISKAIILMTDGENHEGNIVEPIKEAKKKGIHFSVIGIGTPEGAPLIDATTGNYRKDNNGNAIVCKLNEDMCREIAKEGKGLYVRLDNTDNAIKTIYKEIDKLTKSDIESKIYTDFDEQFQYLAFIIFILLLIELSILSRKTDLIGYIKRFLNK